MNMMRGFAVGVFCWLVFAPHNSYAQLGDADHARTRSKPPRYRIVDLGRLSGHEPPLADGFGTYAQAINNLGEIVGYDYFSFPSVNVNGPVAFLYDNGQMQNLGTLGGYISLGLAINDAGIIVGAATTAGDPVIGRHAFLYDGTMHDLGTLGGRTSAAFAINRRGKVVGQASLDPNDTVAHAFIYDNGVMRDLGTLEGTTISEAKAINDRDHIVGNSGSRGFFFDGTMHDLGTFGGATFVEAINDRDLVVGCSQLPNGTYHAYAYDGAMHDLGAMNGGSTFAKAVNRKGQVVGQWVSGNAIGIFLYQRGELFDLKPLLDSSGSTWSLLLEANGINESGQIVGNGIKNAGIGVYAFRLDPIQRCDDLTDSCDDAEAED